MKLQIFINSLKVTEFMLCTKIRRTLPELKQVMSIQIKLVPNDDDNENKVLNFIHPFRKDPFCHHSQPWKIHSR